MDITKILVIVFLIWILYTVYKGYSDGDNKSPIKNKSNNYLTNGVRAFISGFKKETNIEYEKKEIERLIANQKVNHILHLILSLVTAGFWLIIWLLISLSSSIEIRRLNRKLEDLYKLQQQQAQSHSESITNANIKLSDEDRAELKSLFELKELNIITSTDFEEKKRAIVSRY